MGQAIELSCVDSLNKTIDTALMKNPHSTYSTHRKIMKFWVDIVVDSNGTVLECNLFRPMNCDSVCNQSICNFYLKKNLLCIYSTYSKNDNYPVKVRIPFTPSNW